MFILETFTTSLYKDDIMIDQICKQLSVNKKKQINEFINTYLSKNNYAEGTFEMHQIPMLVTT